MNVYIDTKSVDIFRVLSLVTVSAGLIALAYYSLTVFAMLVAAGFLALIISPVVDKVSVRLPVGGRKLAAISVFLVLAAVVGFVIALLVPLVTGQSQELAERIPVYLQQLGDGGATHGVMGVDVRALVNSVFTELENALVITVDLTVTAVKRLINNVFIFFLTILLAFAMVVEGPGLIGKIRALIPKHHRSRINKLSERMQRAVTGFVGGQLIITSIASTLTLLVAILLGLPSPLSLAAIIWLTGLIPLVGNTMGATVVILVALPQSFLTALALLVFYVIYQQIENNILEPYIQANRVRLTPLYVLLSALIGVHVAGFLGALLAIPAGACVRILVDEFIDRPKG